MKIIDKDVEIETDKDGSTRVREKLDIACESQEEAERVKSVLKGHLEESLKRLESERSSN